MRGSGGRSGAQSRTFNQEIFEKKFAFAGVERTAAAKARHITLGRWPWQGFKSDNFVLCRADGAMEQRCYRFHTHPRICDPAWSSSVAPVLHRCLGGSRSPGPLANRHTQGNSTPARTSLGNDAAWASFRPRFPYTLVCGELPAKRLGRMSRLWNSKLPTARFLGSPPLIGVLN